MKVLVVEDNDDTRELIKTMLQIKGCQVIEATDGVEAVKVARREKPDLILMDLNMPVMDGFEATRQIKQQSETLHIPVIAMSAHCWETDWQAKAIDVGCIECIRKPVDFGVIDSVLSRYTS